ncbi:MAG: peptidoglycan DD-metalloendopeptidase family protein [Candidatus Eremiobacteraeota bacterium]|nr:peptidoglycan DD-metalloendopeptidase family protein [Candidatus Eremiobacteraeota bacterium]
MINNRYYVKIVPHKGETVHRFHVRRRHIIGVIVALALVILFGGFELIHARAEVAAMQAQATRQQATLKQIDTQADALRKQLQRVQKQNQEIRQLIGAPPPKGPAHSGTQTSSVQFHSLSATQARIAALSAQSLAVQQESDSMQRLAMHVLNLRHLHDLARAQMIAAIPSIDPVAGAQVIGCFCYRTSPDVEFHPGVDLGADYGDAVHASAAGTVVANSWDGGYGIKIDIDHGNGYHTWYAHLSKVDVEIGAHVYKGQLIGEVGSTGFSTGPHLHYQIMKNGVAVDPTPYLDGVPSNVIAKLP